MFRSRLSLSAFVLTVALVLSGARTFAEDTSSGNYVMPGCRSLAADKNTDQFLLGLCSGLIAGVLYNSGDVCMPDGVTHAQERRVVVQYIDSRPARMHEDFRALALEAMKAAWPCKR
jgi:Rap1a immunity proteins